MMMSAANFAGEFFQALITCEHFLATNPPVFGIFTNLIARPWAGSLARQQQHENGDAYGNDNGAWQSFSHVYSPYGLSQMNGRATPWNSHSSFLGGVSQASTIPIRNRMIRYRTVRNIDNSFTVSKVQLRRSTPRSAPIRQRCRLRAAIRIGRLQSSQPSSGSRQDTDGGAGRCDQIPWACSRKCGGPDRRRCCCQATPIEPIGAMQKKIRPWVVLPDAHSIPHTHLVGKGCIC